MVAGPDRLGDDVAKEEVSEATKNAAAIINAAQGLLNQIGSF